MIISESFIKTWFALQRQLIAGLQVAYVDLQGRGVRPGGLVVSDPEQTDSATELALAASLAQRSGGPVSSKAASQGGDERSGTLRVACPLQLGEQATGAVVVEVDAPPERQAAIVQLLKWGEAWLNLAVAELTGAETAGGYAAMVDAGLAQSSYCDAAAAVLALLPAQTGSTRVALGRGEDAGLAVEAVSDVDQIDRRGARVKAVRAAMVEAQAADDVVCWPDDDGPAQPSHQALLQATGLRGLCTVALREGLPEPLVFCFEFVEASSLPARQREACAEAARVAAPLLTLRHTLNRPWWQRLAALAADAGHTLLMPAGRTRRGLAAAAMLALLLFAVTPGEYRVAAPAGLEGAVQQAVVAPFDSYVAAAGLRAGQRVSAGDLLARLDDRELRGERRRQLAEEAELVDQHRQAVATLDHGKAKVLDSQLDQVRARLALLDDQLARTELRAPLDGLVISGDWSRSLGVPVARGELMFEVAPLDSYRVAIEVSDRDIAGFAVGQTGELILSALPREPVRFEVAAISSLASDAVGPPAFRVEAVLRDSPPALRPGMQGIAKVVLGERQRWWIWTHSLTDWLRLQAWRLLP